MPTPRGLPNDSVFRLFKDTARRLAQLERRVTQGRTVTNLTRGTATQMRETDESGVFRPGQHGYEVWTFDPALGGTLRSINAGTIYLARFDTTRYSTVNGIDTYIGGTADAAFAVGIYDQGGSLVTTSAGQSTLDGLREVSTDAGTLSPGRVYYMAWVAGSITDPPLSFLGWGAYNTEIMGARLGASGTVTDYRAAYIAGTIDGAFGQLPGTINMGSVTSDSVSLWGAAL